MMKKSNIKNILAAGMGAGVGTAIGTGVGYLKDTNRCTFVSMEAKS